MTDDLMQRLMAELSKDGRPVCFIQCNSCGYIEAFHPTDISAEEFRKEGKKVIMRHKKHFEEEGWKTSWGYDLCPDCVKEESNGKKH